MPALREVIASFSVVVEDKALTKLDRDIERSKAALNRFANAAAVGFAATGFAMFKMIQHASDAREQLNVLNQTFGKEGTRNITDWSETMAEAMGRSKFEIQKSVGQFGAFLQPTFRETGEDFQKMSKKLSALAIDLASFYNTSDQEAQMRLFSGISGETEAVRRLGIDLSDAALDAFNKTGGAIATMGERGQKMSKKLYANLSLPEKTTLRYLKILKDTAEKQGDAQRTSGEWEGSLKRLRGRLMDIVTVAGEKLIPMALEWLHALERTLPVLEGILKHSDSLGGVLEILAAAYVSAKLRATLFFSVMQKGFKVTLTHAWQTVAPLAAMLLVLTAIQDVFGFLRGQDSVFGDFVKEVTGAKQPLKEFKDLMEQLAASTAKWLERLQNVARVLTSIVTQGGIITLLRTLIPDADKANPLITSEHQGGAEGTKALQEASKVSGMDSAVQANDIDAFVAASPTNVKESDARRIFLQRREDYVNARPEERTQVDHSRGVGGAVSPSEMKDLENFISHKASLVSPLANVRSYTPSENKWVQSIVVELNSKNLTIDQLKKEMKGIVEEANREGAGAMLRQKDKTTRALTSDSDAVSP